MTARLDEYDKDEWRLVVRRACRILGGEPITDEQFEVMWAEFVEMKRRKKMQ